MSMHPFIWCITIKPVALCIIEHTWSLETLRSLHSMVSTYGNHRACEKEEILKKITEKIEESRKLSEIIFKSHNDGWYDFPDQACHLCQAYPGHNVDHYSIHLTSNDRQEPRSELLGYDISDIVALLYPNCFGVCILRLPWMWRTTRQDDVWSRIPTMIFVVPIQT